MLPAVMVLQQSISLQRDEQDCWSQERQVVSPFWVSSILRFPPEAVGRDCRQQLPDKEELCPYKGE